MNVIKAEMLGLGANKNGTENLFHPIYKSENFLFFQIETISVYFESKKILFR